MSFVSKSGESYADSDALIAELHTLLSSAGWSVLDELDATPGQEDRVYSSLGEEGDEALFLRLTHDAVTGRIYFRGYGFWDSVNHVGYFEVGNVSGGTAIQCGSSMTGWIGIDLDGLGVVVKVGTAYHKFVAARLERLGPQQLAGRTKLAAPLGGANEAGSSQLYVSETTDFGLFLPDMKVWVVNQKIVSGVHAELVEILSVSAGTRTIFLKSPLVNTYDFGALVAQSPQPLVLWGNLAGKLEGANLFGLFGPNSYVARVMGVVSSRSLIPSLALDEYGNLMSGTLTVYQIGSGVNHVFGGMGNRLLDIPLTPISDEDTLTYDGTSHVMFKETNKAWSLRVG